MIFFGFTWLSAFYGALLLTLVSSGWTFSKAIFSFRPLRKLGMIAYGVYLLHIPIVGIVFGALWSIPPRISNSFELGAASLSLCAIFALAALSLRYFEQPFQKWGRLVAYERSARILANASQSS
jgi:peptidoglycan/LPS O-acetylase OafA/YrhL